MADAEEEPGKEDEKKAAIIPVGEAYGPVRELMEELNTDYFEIYGFDEERMEKGFAETLAVLEQQRENRGDPQKKDLIDEGKLRERVDELRKESAVKAMAKEFCGKAGINETIREKYRTFTQHDPKKPGLPDEQFAQRIEKVHNVYVKTLAEMEAKKNGQAREGQPGPKSGAKEGEGPKEQPKQGTEIKLPGC